MNSRTLHLLAFLLGGIVVWIAKSLLPHASGPTTSPPTAEVPTRRIRYYQSPMHPWIRSDHPGRCTICGMELAPVFEGDAGMESDPNQVTLGTNAIQVLHVAVSEVRKSSWTRTLRLAGNIDDNDQRHRMISAAVDARIERLEINRIGQEVVAGELLATVYSPSLLAAEREYAALARSRPGGDLDPSGKAGLLAAARQRLIQMGVLPSQIEALPGKDPSQVTSEIRSPGSGTVVAKRVYEGQYVKEGEALFETADFASMWVQLDAYETDLPWIRIGQAVRIRTPSTPARDWEGKVDFIDPNLDPMTRSTRVRVVLENPLEVVDGVSRRVLRHRLTAIAEIRSVHESLAVSRSAVLRGGGDPVVYVDQGGGAFERRVIQTGRVGDEMLEVLGGLAPGERVVVRGNLLMDAQAQLNSGSPAAMGLPGSGSDPAATSRIEETDPTWEEFIRLVGGLSESLAADDLSGFQKAIRHYGHVMDPLRSKSKGSAWNREVEALPTLPAESEFSTLPGARRWYAGFSGAAVAAARAALPPGRIPDLRFLQCPMTDRALPGGPKKAVWLQLGKAVRNPYFGSAMLDCGNELQEKP